MSGIVTAAGLSIRARRRLWGMSIGAAILILASSLIWWSPHAPHDHDPNCQPGQTRMIITQQVTPTTMLPPCIPETFIPREFRDLSPR